MPVDGPCDPNTLAAELGREDLGHVHMRQRAVPACQTRQVGHYATLRAAPEHTSERGKGRIMVMKARLRSRASDVWTR
jgi:hypothetical protein